MTIPAILLTLAATTAHAQSAVAPPRYPADVGIVADFAPNAFGDSPTATPSLKTSVGAALPYRWTARFELTEPDRFQSSRPLQSRHGQVLCKEIRPRA